MKKESTTQKQAKLTPVGKATAIEQIISADKVLSKYGAGMTAAKFKSTIVGLYK